MNLEAIVVTLDRDMEALVPIFMTQRNADLATLRVALAARDFDAMRKVGHGMAGAGASYGFDYVSVLGEQIVAAARACDASTLNTISQEFNDYMARLVVKYM